MNNILEEAKKLNLLIKETSEYKEYQTYLKLKKDSKELLELNQRLQEEKNKICLKNNGEKESTKEFYEIKDMIDNHPIMINYQNAYEKLNQYLFQIINVINKDL